MGSESCKHNVWMTYGRGMLPNAIDGDMIIVSLVSCTTCGMKAGIMSGKAV